MNISMSKHSLAAASLILGGQVLAGCAAPAAQSSTASPQPGTPALPVAPQPPTGSAPANSSAVAAAASSPFHVVARGSDLQLIRSGDDLILFENGSQLLARVEGDRIVNHPEYLGSYRPSEMESFNLLGGKWPDEAWFTVGRPAQRTGYTVLYEKAGKRWQLRGQTEVSEYYQGIQEWDQGRRIALVTGMFPGFKWKILRGNQQNAPKPQRDASCKDPECLALNAAAEIPVGFAALTTGHLFAVGALLNEERSWVIERWEPNQVNSRMDKLPIPSDPTLMPMVQGIAAFAPNDIFVYGQLDKVAGEKRVQDNVGAYLVHFDGSNWTFVPFQSAAGITSMSSSDGVLWAASGGLLWKRIDSNSPWLNIVLPSVPADLAETKRAMPKPKFPPETKGAAAKDEPVDWQLAAIRVMAKKGGDVWVESVVGKKGHAPAQYEVAEVVLRNRPHSEVWQPMEGDKQARAIEKYQPLRPANEYCTSIFVLLYGMTRTTPKDYDYPLTRAALKGHREFTEVTFAETEDRGEHYFGAFVQDFELAKRLLAVIRKNVKDSKPVMICRHPKKVRLLEFDLATGAVTKNAKVDE